MHKMVKCAKRDQFSPSAMGGSFFGLKTGSRGTPWNSKSAQPGGSDFTKCRFWPFKWHFGLFQGGSIFDHFFVIFWCCKFCHFLYFCIFCFSDFITFSVLSIFDVFWVLSFLSLFHVFYYFDLFFNFSKGILKIRPSFDLFLAPASTPMASTLGGSFPYVKNELFFFLSFLKMCVFLSIFDQFWVIFQFCH